MTAKPTDAAALMLGITKQQIVSMQSASTRWSARTMPSYSPGCVGKSASDSSRFAFCCATGT
jgi:hypothetical protein